MQTPRHRFLARLSICAGLFATACDEDAPPDEPVDKLAVLGEDFDPSLLAKSGRIVVRISTGDGEVQFIERQPLLGEADEPVIDIAEIGPKTGLSVVDPLVAQDATPLEILLHLKPDAEIPAAMAADHARVALARGRASTEIRELTAFRGWELSNNEDICAPVGAFSWQIFTEHILDITTPVREMLKVTLDDDTPLVARNVMIQSPHSTSGRVPVRVCNPESQPYSHCYDDRFQADVFTFGPAGANNVWSGKLHDCDLLKYWWGNRVEDQYYGVQIGDAERYMMSAWYPCTGESPPGYPPPVCEYLSAYIAVGLHN